MRLLQLSPALTATCILAASAAAQSASGRAPDLILFGGRVFTADSTHPWAQSLAIQGDRISAVGTDAEVRAFAVPATKLIDLRGHLVIPGFNDAHDHPGAAPFGVEFATGLSPTPDPSAGQVLDSLRSLAGRTQNGTWLHARIGSRAFEDTALRREVLDAVVPDHPVLLVMWTGHGVILNTHALHALGIAEDAQDPLGGEYERDSAGRLTGALHEYAGWTALRTLYSALSDSMLVAAWRKFAMDGLRLGITSVQDMNGYLDPSTTLRVLHAAQLPLRLRVVPFVMTDVNGRRTAEWERINRQPSPLATVSGIKWILDGTPVERWALMKSAYADRPGWRGHLNFPEDTVRAILQEALDGEPVMLHVVGDSTARLVVALMQELAPDSMWRQKRLRIEHGDGITADLLPTIRRLGIVVVQNPAHFALGLDLMHQRFGQIPADYQMMRSLLLAGVPLALGSDGPRNPFVNIMLATLHPDNPREALTREQAVIAYTRGSAYAEFAERQKGMLAPGMLADFAVLSQDIFAVAPQELPATTSILTVVGGDVEFDAGMLQR